MNRISMLRSAAPSPSTAQIVPQCWGHRGASAAYPENTLASFEAAIKDGADGIESDVHLTLDKEILMFHDPKLDRTTNGTGEITLQNYHGCLDTVMTIKEPRQKIPTFRETLNLLMQEGHEHVLFNIDVKTDNDPVEIFSLMDTIIKSYADYETRLAPRLVLGLWHPKYLDPAVEILPYLRRAHIGASVRDARKYFWEHCNSFSMHFSSLVSAGGQAFIQDCKTQNKDVYVWTVNKRNEMIEAAKWGCRAILTDRTADFLQLKKDIEADWPSVSSETTSLFPWTSIWYYSFLNYLITSYESYTLTRDAGAFFVPQSPPLKPIVTESEPPSISA